MMEEKSQSMFHRTAEGLRACESALPEMHCMVLRAVGEATHFSAIAALLVHQPIDDVLRCLADLEAIGLIESVSLEWLLDLYLLELCEAEPVRQAAHITA